MQFEKSSTKLFHFLSQIFPTSQLFSWPLKKSLRKRDKFLNFYWMRISWRIFRVFKATSFRFSGILGSLGHWIKFRVIQGFQGLLDTLLNYKEQTPCIFGTERTKSYFFPQSFFFLLLYIILSLLSIFNSLTASLNSI